MYSGKNLSKYTHLLSTIVHVSLMDGGLEWGLVTHPVRLNPGQKGGLSKPPEPTLVSCLREDQSSLPFFTLLVDVQQPRSSAVHVVPKLQASSFA